MQAELPPPVSPGDRVGVAALSGPVDPESLERGLEALRGLGFEPVAADNLRDREGLFAGSDEHRLASFHRLAADPTVKAIFFARGGHGVLRLLPRIDWRLLAGRPRAYVGYSDATPFLNQVVARLGLVTLHGPMPAVDLARQSDETERSSLMAALAGRFTEGLPFDEVLGADGAEGPLVGGCLSLLAATVGTPFEVRARGRVLFWEDVGEPLYRIDRMLTQLRLSGTLAGVEAMVVGRVEPADEEPPPAALGELLAELHAELGRPVAWGCPSGHCSPNLTLPLGLRARLSPARRRLEVG